ncbi:MAG: hypothetical protein WCK90_01385 [archaeon]
MSTKLSFENLLEKLDTHSPVYFSALTEGDGKRFAKYYSVNRKDFVALETWGVYAEGGLKVRLNQPLLVGICELGQSMGEEGIMGTLRIPYEPLSRLGFKEGDSANDLKLFAEEGNGGVNIFVVKRGYRQLSKAEYRAVDADLHRLLPNELLESVGEGSEGYVDPKTKVDRLLRERYKDKLAKSA